MNCDNCGLCCKHAGLPPFNNDELNNLIIYKKLYATIQYVDLPVFTQDWTFDRLKSYLTNTFCLWLDDNCKCSYYADRPKLCQKFIVGGKSCLIFRKRASKE